MKQLMDSRAIDDALAKIGSQIIGNHPQLEELALLGIRNKGLELARRICAKINLQAGKELPVGVIDTSLYRDDVNMASRRPVLCGTDVPVAVDHKRIILVDDVLYTGRTIRAALDAITDLGRPMSIHLAVLIDRGHRELPIHADYIGMTISTTRQESVRVLFKKDPAQDEVVLLQEPELLKW
ncbi:MAG: bifunctional pyr operon transcriptional regulator/uracil phosphoribosyltransferase PyrR [Candidatus Schekmanbacteria bacterium]|nr:bifunctional pyr operon transcriptional regulator/uracil phosphoribosyltransferase PyrR [Candidatus Schekmanbacteria bacterium]